MLRSPPIGHKSTQPLARIASLSYNDRFRLVLQAGQEYPRTLSLGYLNGAAAQTRGFEPGPVECWGGRVVNGTGL